MHTLADLSDLTPVDEQLDSDPGLLRLELVDVIKRAISDRPRSQQTLIGPSELGTPCARKLGMKLLGITAVNRSERWRPAVGVATHAWLAEVFALVNQRLGDTRYLIECTVDVGEIDGQTIYGTADLFDRVTRTVVDWKIVGNATLKAVRGQMKATHRTQVNLYGRGLIRRGLPVDRVAVMYLPSGGEFHDAVWQCEDYTPWLAKDALDRAEGIAVAARLIGAEALIPQLHMHDDYCLYCPFFQRGRDSVESCPGAVIERAMPIDELMPL